MHRFLATGLVISVLAGCGGGGASDGGASSPASPAAPAPAPGGKANVTPIASFATTLTPDEHPMKAVFDASASSDSDGSVVSYRWNFGDGNTATGISTNHVFQAAGSYAVRLTVTDNAGASGSVSETLQLDAQERGVRVGGSILIQASSVADSDTNDPAAPRIANDDFASAQTVPNPATIGGYVAAPGRGPATGAAQGGGDTIDVFRFSALGGERVVLAIGTPGEDLDLRLYDEDGREIDASLGLDSTEVLAPVPAAGEYHVAVTTFGNAASTYRLSIGRGPDITSLTVASRAPLRTSAAFVADEVLLGPELDAPRGAAVTPASMQDMPRVERRGGRASVARLRDHYASRTRNVRGAVPLSDAQTARMRTLEAIKRLRASGRYAWVEPNWIHQPYATPNDQYFGSQWNLHAIRVPQAWDLTRGDRDVVVAVIDTGILADHPDLDGQLVPGHDFISDAGRAGDGDGIDADPTDPGYGAAHGNSLFHGTHVAGIIAARTGNGAGDGAGGGVASVGWQTRVMPLRVLGRDGGTSADLIEALRYAGGLPNASGAVPEQPADIINLSLGSASFSEAEQAVIDALRARGIIIVAAAGNEASDSPSYPAGYTGVVSVSATTITDELAYYSNRGNSIDVAAPGGDASTDINGDGIADGVLSTWGDDSDADPVTVVRPTLGVLAGTSMAAPHVAGVAALMKAVFPELTPSAFDALLASGTITEDLGAPGRDDLFGHGRIDAQRAVLGALDAAGRGGKVPGVLIATPTTLNFGPFVEQLEIRLGNAGNLPITTEAPSVDVPWLRVSAADVDGNGLGSWTVAVDRDLLPADGVFRAEVRFPSDANTSTVAVHVQRASVDLSADTGFVHVFLIPVDETEPRYQTTATARSGHYDFELSDIAPGRYRLIAGSDMDHDGAVCDAGEACGGWRTTGAPTILEVGDEDLVELAFTIGFRMSISPNAPVSGRP